MLEKMLSSVLAADALNQNMGGDALDADKMSQLKMWAAGIFRLVVIGEIKKGKSSFINALLGTKNLVPTNANVATSTVFKIHYAPERVYRVFFDKGSGKSPLSINEADLSIFGTEAGNPGNEKQVSFIEVGCPSSLLKSGIVIFDTPGLGGLLKEHRRITYECMPKADAVFFVTDSVESPIGKLETDYLRDIQEITQNIYFVQTKSCATDAESRETRKNSNMLTLERCLNRKREQIPYFLVDSEVRFIADEYKDLEDLKMSGYPALLAFVQKYLQNNQQQLLVERMRKVIVPLMSGLEQRIATQKEILNADSAESREKLSAALQEKQSELNNWKDNEQRLLLDNLKDALQSLNNEAIDLCDRNKPMGELHQKFIAKVESAANISEVQEILHTIQTELPDAACRCMNQIAQRLQEGAVGILSEFGGDQSHVLSTEVHRSSDVPVDMIETAAGKLKSGVDFEDAKAVMYGGMAGAGMASIVGGIIGSVVPVVGTVIGSLVGLSVAGIFGACQNEMKHVEQQREMAKQRALNSIAQVVTALYNEQTKCVKRIIDDINNQVRKSIQTFIVQRSSELASELNLLKERGSMQGAELNKKQRRLAEVQAKYAALAKELMGL